MSILQTRLFYHYQWPRRSGGIYVSRFISNFHQSVLPSIARYNRCLYWPATSPEQSFTIRRYVKTQPKEPTDWERTLTINSGCKGCHSLRRYVEEDRISGFAYSKCYLESSPSSTSYRVSHISSGCQYTLTRWFKLSSKGVVLQVGS